MQDQETFRELGALRAEVNILKADMAEVKGDIKSILAIILEARGGWKVLVTIGTAGGAIGAALTYVASKLFS